MKAYINGRIFNGEIFLKEELSILTDSDTIIDIVATSEIPENAEVIDLKGNTIAPTLIDLQIYGGNDELFGEFPSVKALEATYQYCLAGGAAYFMPTVATNSDKIMYDAIQAVKDYWAQGGKGVLGLHLEGPYMNMAKRGAHIKEFIKNDPSVLEVKKLLETGKDVIKIMTLAPEVVSDDIIKLLQEYGVTVSMGHTNATYAQAKLAIGKGIHAATHLFNAMSPLQHRAPGVVGAIYDDENIVTSVVADGHHVDFSVIKISKTVLKERLFLITDAVTESLKGLYTHRLDGDKYVIADGTLSGSALTMMKAVQNCVEKVGISLEEALRMGSLYPARVMGLDNRLGRIAKGYSADFIVLNTEGALISILK
jgi:N-acetylglucosamine-6-phosphate deacetylase